MEKHEHKITGDGQLPVVRMIVLETDEPNRGTQSRRGPFGEILHHHFAAAGKAQDLFLGIETDRRFVVTEKGGTMSKFSDFEDYHVVLITGSIYDADGDNPWILELLGLLKKLWVHHPKILLSGLCFGRQLICLLLSAEIARSPSGDWELGHSAINLNDIGKRLFRTENDKVYLNQMHQGQVVEPATSSLSNGEGLIWIR
ncbi:hypothetical protein QBC38DRAFT_60956 [Podospora fimiseda]|uniref:Glutamine amidotransferase domain-containing protein n=1 Tax=Podospora fimiseda TaxID=252190 RepID=A0AAN7BGE4_9PEZI|nr:hypothetical protein QBC38DRAFT_60956 [Podospora fimiseda]